MCPSPGEGRGVLGGGAVGSGVCSRKSSSVPRQPLPGPPLPSQGREQNEKPVGLPRAGRGGVTGKAGGKGSARPMRSGIGGASEGRGDPGKARDRKSTRLNTSQ